MKINTHHIHRKKAILLTVTGGAILIAAAVGVLYATHTWPFSRTSQTTSSEIDTTNPLGTNKDTLEENGNPAKSPLQYEGSDPNATPSLTGFVTFSSVMDDNLVIRTTIDQSLDSGTCKLTLTKGDVSVIRTSDIVANPSSSACSGFDVPKSELGSGKWSIQITLTSGNKTGEITSEASI